MIFYNNEKGRMKQNRKKQTSLLTEKDEGSVEK